jgi:hypothetical protein
LGPNDLEIVDYRNAQSGHFVDLHQLLQVDPQRWFVLPHGQINRARLDALNARFVRAWILNGPAEVLDCAPSGKVMQIEKATARTVNSALQGRHSGSYQFPDGRSA